MSIAVIEYKGNTYPALQAKGFAAQYAFPFALQICHPDIKTGYDIGCNRADWCLPGAYPIDPTYHTAYDAYKLPEMNVDYIFSSHCLEHLRDWVEALDYWLSKLHSRGVLFLYLPHPDQEYWKPYNNRKHIHSLRPEMIEGYMIDRGMKNVFVTGRDLNHSFYAIAEKA